MSPTPGKRMNGVRHAGPPDRVVFTDIGLGKGLNGWDVAEEARKAPAGDSRRIPQCGHSPARCCWQYFHCKALRPECGAEGVAERSSISTWISPCLRLDCR